MGVRQGRVGPEGDLWAGGLGGAEGHGAVAVGPDEVSGAESGAGLCAQLVPRRQGQLPPRHQRETDSQPRVVESSPTSAGTLEISPRGPGRVPLP
jgi:hypothetical protein